MNESALQRDARLRLGREPDCAVWRNNVGVAEYLAPGGGVQHVAYGLAPGSSDLIGLVGVTIRPEHVGRRVGRFVGLELKAPGASTDRARKEKQRLFRELVNLLGGYSAECRSLGELEAFIKAAREL